MTTGATPRVSLVIPVYDAGPYLRPCLDSVVAQDLAELEVIAVDDGSTDGSGALLDEYAHGRGWRVIHQENSGWPGRPRNVGLDVARGTYVFFLDADDELGPEALRRLADFADEHGSDVVVPKMVGLGGREVAEEVYEATVPDADRVLLFATLTPGKLFRRAFMQEHGLRFPEGRIRLEDGQLVARAYLAARRVSVYADHDCYFLRRREDGGNISYDLGAPSQYTDGIAGVLDVVRANADEALADAVALALYQRKALRQLRPGRWDNYDEARRRAWVDAIAELARAHVPARVEDQLARRFRLRSRLARSGDLRALEALLREQEAGRTEPPVAVRGGRVLLDLPHDTEPLDLTAEARMSAGVTSLRVRRGHVDLQGEVRLRGMRPERIPLRLEAGRPPLRHEQKVTAEAVEGSSWCWFDARVELGEWLASGRVLSLRMKVRGGRDLTARLAVIVPPREDEPAAARAWRARRSPALMRARRAGKRG